MKDKLIKLLDNAHANYSNVKVAAIVKTSKGEFEGVNVENSAFPSSMCAERSAIYHAVSKVGSNQEFEELHLISSLDHKLYPCGACRQVIKEFFKEDTPIFVYGKDGSVHETNISELLPNGVDKGSFGWK